MSQNSILEAMIGHHALIELYFTIAKEGFAKDDIESTKENFNNFKWQIEKHFFVEGKAILDSYTLKNEEANNLIKQVYREHKEIMEMISRINDNLQNGEKEDLSGLEELIGNHRKMEEEKLYPLLDKEFNQIQKEVVFRRISEIVIVGE